MQYHKHISPHLSDADVMSSRSAFTHDRFFHVMNAGWYIEMRDRNLGPFPSHEVAMQAFEDMIASAPFDSCQSVSKSR